MIKEEVINNTILLGMGVGQYLRVSRRYPTLDQNSIFFLEIDPILFLGLNLIDPRPGLVCIEDKSLHYRFSISLLLLV